MQPFAIISIILIGLLTGCNQGPIFGGGSASSYGNPDHETTTEVVTQCDHNGHLLFVIAWTTKGGGGTTSYSERNLLTRIHGHPVHPNLEHQAVYALQTDGSLQQIPLTGSQVNALFQEMQQAGFHPSHSELWEKLIAPHLVSVEAPNGS